MYTLQLTKENGIRKSFKKQTILKNKEAVKRHYK